MLPTYVEMPGKYTFNKPKKEWQVRQRGFSLGRVHTISPLHGDVFYLRFLLHDDHCRGKISFRDLLTIDGEVHETYQSVCRHLGLLSDEENENLRKNVEEYEQDQYEDEVCTQAFDEYEQDQVCTQALEEYEQDQLCTQALEEYEDEMLLNASMQDVDEEPEDDEEYVFPDQALDRYENQASYKYEDQE